MIPWALYNLTPRDQGSPLIRVFHERKTVTATATGSTLQFDIPAEHVLLLTSFCTSCEATAGVASRVVTWAYNNSQAAVHWEHIHYATATINRLSGQLAASPIVTLGVDDTIYARGEFTSSVLHNVTASIAGILIPKGTIAVH